MSELTIEISMDANGRASYRCQVDDDGISPMLLGAMFGIAKRHLSAQAGEIRSRIQSVRGEAGASKFDTDVGAGLAGEKIGDAEETTLIQEKP